MIEVSPNTEKGGLAMTNSFNSRPTTGALDTLRQATGPGYQAAFNGHLLNLAYGKQRQGGPHVKF